MSADVAQPPSPPRILGGSRGSSEPHQQQHHQHHQHHKQLSSSGSSSLRLSDEPEPGKSPQSSSSLTTGSGTSSSNASGYSRRDGRRRSECTDTGSIGYGSSAPLESETSYSSHPGYASAGAGRANCSGKSDLSSPTSHLNGSRMHLHGLQSGQMGSISLSPSQSSSSTPSSGAYVDVSSSRRLAGPASSSSSTSTTTPLATASTLDQNGGGGSRRPGRNAIVKSRTAPLPPSLSPAISSPGAAWNNNNGAVLPAESETGYVVDYEKGNAYYKGQLLGKGGFARVYLITDIATRKQYACKIIPKNQMQKIHMQKIAREIMIHKELNHVNIVQMHHYFEDSRNVYMLLEACPKKSLVNVLKYRGKVTEPEARYYMKQMVTGVAYIHSQKVIHRDLKPGNMFLSERMIVKIGDFGLATQPDGQRRRVTICGTPNFIAPEVLFKQSYCYEADVWALGCILYVLLVGQPPFDSPTLKETYARICSHRYKELDDSMASRAGQDLVRWLLQPNPKLRLPLQLVKEHPYLTREYVPASLPESYCFQAPRLPFDERIQPPPPLLAGNDLAPSTQYARNQVNYLEHPLQQSHPMDGKKSKCTAQGSGSMASGAPVGSTTISTKKKKVSSWLASWRLPKLPRFRQRISSVLCLEARKKPALGSASAALGSLSGEEEPLQAGGASLLPGCSPGNPGSPVTPSQICLMSRALEECLGAVSSGGSIGGTLRATCGAPLVQDYAPLFVTKWIDYSNKYGLAFQLSDRSVGVLFNDSTKMSYTHDRRRVEYMTADDEVTRYSRERNVPAHLQEKLQLLRHFTDYMDKHLTEGGEVTVHRTEPSQQQQRERDPNSRRSSSAQGSKNSASVPLMRRWLRTSKAIVMELSVPLLQMNFFEDHTKLIVSREHGAVASRGNLPSCGGYLVTYIDGERRASTYWLEELRELGCSAELHERLLYVYKVAKEFAELDAAAR